MSTELNRFNSMLIQSLRAEGVWEGNFYSKLVKLLDEKKKPQGIVEALINTFNTGTVLEQEPSIISPQKLRDFGKGNIGSDVSVMNFFDTAFVKFFSLIKQKNFQQLSELSQEIIDKVKESGLSFKVRNELQKYWLLLQGFNRFSNKKTKPNYVAPIDIQYKINNINDLAFLGITGAIEDFLIVTGDLQIDNSFFINDISTENIPRKESQIPINQTGLNVDTLSTSDKSPLLQLFFEHNKDGTLVLPSPSFKITDSLPQILGNSSFLWKNELNYKDSGGTVLTHQKIMEMDYQKRINILLKNKATVIKKCFLLLKNSVNNFHPLEALSTEELMYLIDTLQYQENTSALKEKRKQFNTDWMAKQASEESRRYFLKEKRKQFNTDWMAKQASIRKIGLKLDSLRKTLSPKLEKLKDLVNEKGLIERDFINTSVELGKTEGEAATELLKLISETQQPLPQKKSGIEGVFVRAANRYRNILVQGAATREECRGIYQEIKQTNLEMKTAFSQVQNIMENLLTSSKTHSQNVLSVYTTFSFIVLNEDLFPPISSLKASSNKLQKTFESIKRKFNNILPSQQKTNLPHGLIRHADESEQNYLIRHATELDESDLKTNMFELMINEKAKNIFKNYAVQTDSFKYKIFSETDFSIIAEVAKGLAEDDNPSLEKFEKLDKILQQMLLKDNALREMLEKTQVIRIERNQDPRLFIAHYDRRNLFLLTSRMNACLLLSNSTSMGNQGVFSKILQDTINSITPEGIKSDIKENLKALQEITQSLAIPRPTDTVQKLIEKELLNPKIATSKELELKLVPLGNSTQQKLQLANLNTAMSSLKDFINSEIMGNSYFRQVTGIKQIMQGERQGNQNKKLRPFWEGGFNYSKLYGNITIDISNYLKNKFSFGHKIILKQGLNAFQDFWIDNQYDLQSLPQESYYKKSTPISEDSDLLWAAYMYQNLKQEKKELEVPMYQVVERNFMEERGRVDLFQNQTFFNILSRKRLTESSQLSTITDLYQNYLPIFVASFTDIGNPSAGTSNLLDPIWYRLGVESKTFERLKFDLIKDLPGAERVFQETSQWKIDNQQQILDINTFLQNQVEENADRLREFPEEIGGFIYQTLQEVRKRAAGFVNNARSAVKSAILTTAVYSSIIALLLWKAGILGPTTATLGLNRAMSGIVILGMICASIHTVAKPYIISVFNSWCTRIKEGGKYYLSNLPYGSEEYTAVAPTNFLLATFENALQTSLVTFNKIHNPGHLLQKIQSTENLFNAIELSRNNLMVFPQQLSSLTPYAVEQSEFSVIALNQLYMLNRVVFQLVPEYVLKNSSDTNFSKKVEEYLRNYKELLKNEAYKFNGDTTIAVGQDNDFSRYLKGKAERGELRVEFDGKTILVTPGQILPFKDINPSVYRKNMENLIQGFSSALEMRESFYVALERQLPFIEKQVNASLGEEDLEQVMRGLVSSYEMVRYGFNMAQHMEDANNRITNAFEKYLLATGESSKEILNSKIMSDSVGMLRKTVDFACALGFPEGVRARGILKKFQLGINNFLSGASPLYRPTFQDINALNSDIYKIISNIEDNPVIAAPTLFELDRNPGLFLPLIVWEFFKQEREKNLGEEGALVMNQTLINSKILYLTGEDFAMDFYNARMRGLSFSPFMFNAIDSLTFNFSNTKLVNFLGGNQIRSIEYIIPAMNPIQQSNILPEQTYYRQQQASPIVNPTTGLSPLQFDLRNQGLTPIQAYKQFGNQLRPEVRSRIEALNPMLTQPRIKPNISDWRGLTSPMNPQAIQPGVSQQQPAQPGVSQQIPMQQQNQVEQEETQNIFPYVQQGSGPQQPIQGQAPQQQGLQQEVPPQQQEVFQQPQIENQIQYMVDANTGKTIPVSVSMQNQQPERRLSPEDQDFSQQIISKDQDYNNQLEKGQTDWLPPGQENDPYINQENMQYLENDVAIPPAQGFPWGKGAMIGGGALLGAAVLGKLLTKKDDDEDDQ